MLLGEQLTLSRFLGIALIISGVGLADTTAVTAERLEGGGEIAFTVVEAAEESVRVRFPPSENTLCAFS